MPTYEYKCKSCGHIFETFQKITDEPVKVCPKCGGEVIRLISGGVGIIFKGTGFYITDNKSNNKKIDNKKKDLSKVDQNKTSSETKN